MATDPEKKKRRRRAPTPQIPQDDSWGLLVRDMTVFGLKCGVVIVAGLWLAELPAARRLPVLGLLPTISDKPVLGLIPPAAHVFRVKESPEVHAHHTKGHTPRHGKGHGPSAAPGATTAPAARRTAVPAAAKTAAPVAVKTAAPVAAATFPPEVAATAAPVRPVAEAPAPAGPPRNSTGGVKYAARAVNSVPVQVVTVDLLDPRVVATVALANNAARPNVAGATNGDEPFEKLVGRLHAAAVINGTFFSKDAEKRVMGNMVRDGELIKFSEWEKGGTTFALTAANRPWMGTDGVDADPATWNRAWLAVTAGPRLLRNGVTWVRPEDEGFHDPHVLGTAGRSALGFDRAGKKLWLVSFDAAVTLGRAAEIMRTLGCSEAMNLDGGASRSLAVAGRTVVPAGRSLTNVLAFYDRKHPAPKALATAFAEFRPEPAADGSD